MMKLTPTIATFGALLGLSLPSVSHAQTPFFSNLFNPGGIFNASTYSNCPPGVQCPPNQSANTICGPSGCYPANTSNQFLMQPANNGISNNPIYYTPNTQPTYPVNNPVINYTPTPNYSTPNNNSPYYTNQPITTPNNNYNYNNGYTSPNYPISNNNTQQGNIPQNMWGIAHLNSWDQQQALAQRTCPISGELLGSRGQPVRVNLNGQSVFVCCQDYANRAQYNNSPNHNNYHTPSNNLINYTPNNQYQFNSPYNAPYNANSGTTLY